jgi:hypothetical protein
MRVDESRREGALQLHEEKVSVRSCHREFFEALVFRALMRLTGAPGRPNLAVFVKDPIGLSIATAGFFERDLLAFVMSFMRTQGLLSGIALDVGANIGNHSLFFDRHFDGVESFEPHPVTFQMLKLNARLGRSVSVHNLAASDVAGVLSIYNDEDSLGGASSHPHASAAPLERHEVPALPLDSL